MSLIKCPECGKEVSDKAEMCVNCGFGIKEYITDQNKIINQNQNENEEECQAVKYYHELLEKEETEIKEEASQMMFPKLKLFFNINFLIGIIFIIMSIITFSANIMFSVDGSINGFLLLSTLFSLAIGCVNTYVGITKLIKIHELYRQHKNDEKKYKEEVVRLYKAEEAYDEYMKQGIKRIYSEKNQNPHNIKCPYCNSLCII